MTQHTPGPWEVEDSAGGPYVQNNELLIATIVACDPDLEHEFFTGDTTLANARLIAAAPDLLRALRLLLAVTQDDGTGAQREVVTQCREAVEKAEGKE